MEVRGQLEAIWRAGVEACAAERVLPPHLPEPPLDRTLLLAVGKSAVPMARAVERAWDGPLLGLAVAPHGIAERPERIGFATAAHPLPDEASAAAARRLLALASEAGPDDLVLVLLSGGASALACLPADGLTLAAKRELTGALLRSGAPIGEINCVRRHLSGIKGGRLGLAAAPARLVTLAVSDVPGDDPADIGSGPTVADPTTIEEARAILARLGLADPGAWSESAKRVSGDYRIVAGPGTALEAAAARARDLGYEPRCLVCEGEAGRVAREHSALALAAPPGTAILSGGELEVAVQGRGRGGRNQHYALAAAIALRGRPDIAGLAADSDGTDGASDSAGAFFDGGVEGGEDALAANDAHAFFAERGRLFVTGPTGVNVGDLRILLIPPRNAR